jgi:hypothetical protein
MLKTIISSLFISIFPRLASACTVCFGAGDSKLADGFTWGIVLLGSLPFIMLITFITVIVRTTRRRKT